MKKFTDSYLRGIERDGVALYDSGYDSFSKNAVIRPPYGWSAIIVQNGKYIGSFGGDVTVKFLKEKFGLKVPFLGRVKMKVWFGPSTIKHTCSYSNETFTAGKTKRKLTCEYSYRVDAKEREKLVNFVVGHKLKPAAGSGILLTVDGLDYLCNDVVANVVREKSSATGSAFETVVKTSLKNQIFPALGYSCYDLEMKSYKMD